MPSNAEKHFLSGVSKEIEDTIPTLRSCNPARGSGRPAHATEGFLAQLGARRGQPEPGKARRAARVAFLGQMALGLGLQEEHLRHSCCHRQPQRKAQRWLLFIPIPQGRYGPSHSRCSDPGPPGISGTGKVGGLRHPQTRGRSTGAECEEAKAGDTGRPCWRGPQGSEDGQGQRAI